MLPRLLTLASTGWLIALPHLAQAQQPLIDAGQQAMIQHYNNLIEQQSAPDQEEAAEEARRARGRGEAPEAAMDERCNRDAVREKLRPEYEQRARSEGADAAAAWLRSEAAKAGRYAAQNC